MQRVGRLTCSCNAVTRACSFPGRLPLGGARGDAISPSIAAVAAASVAVLLSAAAAARTDARAAVDSAARSAGRGGGAAAEEEAAAAAAAEVLARTRLSSASHSFSDAVSFSVASHLAF